MFFEISFVNVNEIIDLDIVNVRVSNFDKDILALKKDKFECYYDEFK